MRLLEACGFEVVDLRFVFGRVVCEGADADVGEEA